MQCVDGRERAVRSVVAKMKWEQLHIPQIDAALFPTESRLAGKDDVLTPEELASIEAELGVSLPRTVVQEHCDDARVRRLKVYTALVIFSGDSPDAKTSALLRMLGSSQRDWVRFLEWKLELQVGRLGTAAVAMGEIEAKTWRRWREERTWRDTEELVRLGMKLKEVKEEGKKEVIRRVCSGG